MFSRSQWRIDRHATGRTAMLASKRHRHRRLADGPERLESRQLLAAGPVITEFVASNLTSLVDGDRETPDWIEVFNPTDEPVLLRNYYLTDDADELTKWQFPDRVALGPGQYLVVLASGRDLVDAHGQVHTNFSLAAEGEYLALATATGEVLTEFDAGRGSFPSLRTDLAWGFAGSGLPGTANGQYLAEPTPGAVNTTEVYEGILPPPLVSRPGGFYDGPFKVSIQAPEAGMGVLYTTDATDPARGGGTLVAPGDARELASATIMIDSTTVLQAITVRDGWLSPLTVGHTYLFLEDVIQQDPLCSQSGRFPVTWYGSEPAVYAFDERIVDHSSGVDKARLIESLKSLPSMTLVVDHNALWASDTGIYMNPLERGPEWRRQGSVEVFGSNVQLFSHVHTQLMGGTARTGLKPSLRIDLRDEIGGAESILIPPLSEFAEAPVQSLALRVNSNDAVQDIFSPSYIRDTWLRATLSAAGNNEARSQFVHLYINGLYWGIVTVTERVRAEFVTHRLGGNDDEVDIITPTQDVERKTELVEGTWDAWLQLFEVVRTPDLGLDQYMRLRGHNANGDLDTKIQPLLDVENLVDYILTHVMAGAFDWPQFNYVAIRQQSSESNGFQFFAWDQERHTDGSYYDWVAPTPANVITSLWTPLELFYELLDVPKFRIDVADSIYRNFFHAGALTREASVHRWASLASSVEPGILAEVARWAAAEPLKIKREPPYWTVEDWHSTIDWVAEDVLPRSYELAMERFRAAGWYPSIDPPQVNRRGGPVPAGFAVTLTASEGTIYYTLDGSDPRALEGLPNTVADIYAGPIALETTTTLKARLLSPDGQWSALEKVTYEVDVEDAGAANLRITEVHYHPEPNGEEEFLELANVGPRAVRLEGVRIEGGVTFDFSHTAAAYLASGERLVVVRNAAAFKARYGDRVFVAGEYAGNLSNGGEELSLRDAAGQVIQSFHYRDDQGWPVAADGGGRSLQLVDPYLDSALPASWRASSVPGGTPGREAYAAGDANLDGRFNSSDLVLVFQAGKYERPAQGTTTWSEGDWNGDGRFDSADLVLAFQTGSYEVAARPRQRGDVQPRSSSSLFLHLASALADPITQAHDAYFEQGDDDEQERLNAVCSALSSPL